MGRKDLAMKLRNTLHNRRVIKPKQQHSKHRYVRLVLLIVLFIGFIFGVVDYTKIKVVSIRPSKTEETSLINQYSNDLSKKVIGSNIFFYNRKSISVNVKGKSISFEIDKITKNYPNRIEIYVNVISDHVTISDGTSYFYVANNGLILMKVDRVDDKVIPVINQRIKVGGFIKQPIVDTIYAILNDGYFADVKKLSVSENKIVIESSKGYTVVFPVISNESILSDRLKLLKKIAQQYTIDSRGIDTIDLRYSKPVIKFN